jgi:hypothetical protein
MKINNLFEDVEPKGPNDAGVRYWIALWDKTHNIEDKNVYNEDEALAAIREYIFMACQWAEYELEAKNNQPSQSMDPFSDVEDEPKRTPLYSVTVRISIKASAGEPHYIKNPVTLIAGLTINVDSGTLTAYDDTMTHVWPQSSGEDWSHPLLQPIVALLREMNVELT